MSCTEKSTEAQQAERQLNTDMLFRYPLPKARRRIAWNNYLASSHSAEPKHDSKSQDHHGDAGGKISCDCSIQYWFVPAVCRCTYQGSDTTQAITDSGIPGPANTALEVPPLLPDTAGACEPHAFSLHRLSGLSKGGIWVLGLSHALGWNPLMCGTSSSVTCMVGFSCISSLGYKVCQRQKWIPFNFQSSPIWRFLLNCPASCIQSISHDPTWRNWPGSCGQGL